MSSLDSALFYALSTIAQTLAAAIALLGTFVLFRMQALTQSLEALAKELDARSHQFQASDPPSIHLMVTSGLHRELVQNLRDLHVEELYSRSLRSLHADTLKARIELLELFRRALIAVVVVIAMSITGLALTPVILPNRGVASLVIGATTVGCLMGLYLCARLVYVAVRVRPA